MQVLIKTLYEYDYAYYVENKPLVSDEVYDGVRLALIKKEDENNIPENERYSFNIGVQSLHDNQKHVRKIYSMDHVYNIEEVGKFLNKVSKYTDHAVLDFKHDGIAIEVMYRNSVPTIASTRGSGGEVGMNITKNFLFLVPDLPLHVDKYKNFEVYGELVLSKKYYDKYGEHADLRSIVGGLVTRKKELDAIQATFIVYDIHFEGTEFLTYSDKMNVAKELGFTVPDQKIVMLEEVEYELALMEDKKDTFEFETDGVCIKVDPIDTRDAMGYTKRFPKYQLAYKWSKPPFVTKLKEVIWDIGPSRRYTPTGMIEPIDTGSRKYVKVNLHSFFNIQAKGICLNDSLLVSINGGLIPKVLGTIPSKENTTLPIIPPKNCYYCGSEIKQEGKHLFCSNVDCSEAKVKTIAESKKRLTRAQKDLLRVLYKKGFIEDISDIKTVDFNDISCYYIGKLEYGKKTLNALQTML